MRTTRSRKVSELKAEVPPIPNPHTGEVRLRLASHVSLGDAPRRSARLSRQNSIKKSPPRPERKTPVKRRSTDKENATPSPARSTRSRGCARKSPMYLDVDRNGEPSDASISPIAKLHPPKRVQETPNTKAMMNQLETMELNSVKKTPPRNKGAGRSTKADRTLESVMKSVKLSSEKKPQAEPFVDRPSTSTRSARRSLFTPGASRVQEQQQQGALAVKVRLKKASPNYWRIAGPDSPFGVEKKPTTVGKPKPFQREPSYVIESDEDDLSTDENLSETDEDLSEDEDFVSRSQRTNRARKMPRSKATSRCRNSAKDLGVSPMKRPKMETERVKPHTLPWVRSQLCAAVVPDRLPCREAEYRHIETFFKNAVAKNGHSQSMYISGVPGTGKTATVLQVSRMLKATPKFPKFQFVRVNAMELADPKQFFVAVFTQLFPELAKKRIAVGTARRKLNDMFLYKDAKRLPVVLLVDELDLLCTKRQDIIYDIFNWSAVPESRVNVIAIANTLDLPERALSLRITSRIGFNRLTFQPYEFEQIGSILQDRLKGAKCISKDAVQFASRKVASISGDLRKALDVVKRAAEIAIELSSASLELKHVQAAIEEAKSAYRSELVATLSRHEKAIIHAVLEETTSTGIEEMSFQIILRNYRAISRNKEGIEPLSPSAAYACALRLCNCGLLKADSNGSLGWLYRTFRLAISPQDLRYCLNLQQEKTR